MKVSKQVVSQRSPARPGSSTNSGMTNLFGGAPTPWDAPVTRIEAGGGFYLQRNLTLRGIVQRNWRDGGRVRNRTFVSGQISYWF